MLTMSEYPTLPIVVDEATGFEYFKGHNLFDNTYPEWSDWWTPGTGTNRSKTYKTFNLADINYQANIPLSFGIEIEARNVTAGTLLVQSNANGTWSGSNPYWFPRICSGPSMAQDLIHINNTPKQMVRNNYKLSVSELAKAYLDGRKGVQIVNIRIDNANAEAQIRVRHLMLNYGAEVADYRPNPLNLVGGGGAYGDSC